MGSKRKRNRREEEHEEVSEELASRTMTTTKRTRPGDAEEKALMDSGKEMLQR